ncbi:alanine--tRNA ligase [Patescibacteria group bacterium]|nr:alanine--tRNA ligase [Patescibacteria group bacterium]
MTIHEIRSNYLTFFKERGHAIIPSTSLIPENDPTTLFTGSGMQPLIPYLLGKNHPEGTRLVDSQKCFRQMDIDDIGDNRHTTFFEMLGNWSLGDYFKEEQLTWFFHFLIDEVGLEPERLYVTTFIGNEELGIPRDTESARIWKNLFAQKGIEALEADMGSEEEAAQRGMRDGERIFYYDASKNWWSRSGVPHNMPPGEPGGPDSEVFFDFGTPHDPAFGPLCHPNCDCGRFLEIGNSVFMEYLKGEDGSFGPLPKKNVDFGGGLERIAAAQAKTPDVFQTSAFAPIIDEIESLSAAHYQDPEKQRSFRIIADHLRGAVFMVGDGVLPANTEAGYVLRRIIRRAVRHMDVLGMEVGTLHEVAHKIVDEFQGAYPELNNYRTAIEGVLKEEEARFRETLARGLREFEKLAIHNEISGADAFTLFTTYGFPVEMTQELAAERGIPVDTEGFHHEFARHQELSRQGSEGKFKGGLGDHSEMSVRYHTATHLLHEALRRTLGEHVEQRGSNITPERLRFDFTHPEKLTNEERAEVERIVNEQIEQDLPVSAADLPHAEAEALGARAIFGEKYGDVVRVYTIGTAEAPFSIEFCGGPHVTSTTELSGTFRITKEESVAAGVRRIKAVLE